MLTSRNPSQTLPAIWVWLSLVALVEFVLLRTVTRALIHIPGLGRFDTPITVLAEVGRFAYYLGVVLLISTLLFLSRSNWEGTARQKAIGALIGLFIVVAAAGRLGYVSVALVSAWSLVTLVGVVALTWNGVRSVPAGLFVSASVVAGWSVIGQGAGGGIPGRWVDGAVFAAEALVILAGVTAPLMLSELPGRPAIVAGVSAVAVAVAGLSLAGSTVSIVLLWNLGVPGWFPPVAFGLAFGGLVVAIWSAASSGDRRTAAALVLLFAGGVGTINTYQSGLVLTAMLLLGAGVRGVDSATPRTTLTAGHEEVVDATIAAPTYAGSALESIAADVVNIRDSQPSGRRWKFKDRMTCWNGYAIRYHL